MNWVNGIPAGQMALARMPNGAPSMAAARVSWWIAPLVEPYTEPPQPDQARDRPGGEDHPAALLLFELGCIACLVSRGTRPGS